MAAVIPTIERRRPVNGLTLSMALAVAAIAILNLADVLTTRAVVGHGAIEANPLSSALLAGGRVELLKAGIIVALVLRVPRRRPTVAFHAILWFVAGFYALTVASNLLVLNRVS